MKAFVSYSHRDDRKRELLQEVLEEKGIEPIIVANRNVPSILLSEKVINAINEADYLIPIITKKSIKNQWVNQEIGYAQNLLKKEEIKIIPIIDQAIMNSLKGFIHKEMDLPYQFKTYKALGYENRQFKDKCRKLVNDLKNNKSKKVSSIEAYFNSLIVATIDNQGRIGLNGFMSIENNRNKNILLQEITLYFVNDIFLKDGLKADSIFFKSETYNNEDSKRTNLKYNSISILPHETKQIRHLRFISNIHVPNEMRGVIRNSFQNVLRGLSYINVQFEMHNGEKIQQQVKIIT